MTVGECKKIINGLNDGDALPVKMRYLDSAVGATQTVDVGSLIEEVTHGPEQPGRQIIFCAKV